MGCERIFRERKLFGVETDYLRRNSRILKLEQRINDEIRERINAM